MTEDEYLLYQYIDDLLTSVDAEFSNKNISITEYYNRINEIQNRYQVSKGMSKERQWLEWRIENAGLTEQDKEKHRQRILEIDSGKNNEVIDDVLIGLEVVAFDKGKGKIIRRNGKFITVEFEDCSKTTYEFEIALKSRSLKFANVSIQEQYEQRIALPKNPVVPGISSDKNCLIDLDNTLNSYLDFARSAINASLSKYLFSVILIIHADDDMEYYDILSKIYGIVFSAAKEKRIFQDTLVYGAKRWDSSVDSIFKRIFDGADGIQSIDIREFSVIEPIFIEMIQSIRAASSNSKKLFAIRIKENDQSTPSLLAAKMPTFEIVSSKKTLKEYAEILYTMFPARIKNNYISMKNELLKIVEAEMKSSTFTGEKSLEYVALKISYFINKNNSRNNMRIDADVLSEFYDNTYKSEDEKKTALDQLRGMIGFEDVVDLAEQLIAGDYQKKVLSQDGIILKKTPRHIVFRGPSGCGKTTAARLISQALNEAGISHGFFEANSRSLCGRYLGETRINVQTVIKAADDGILFLDEAYALSIGDEYGQEAISALLTEMENPNSNLIIIFAGYKDEMDSFLNSNPGLRSRIGYTVDFKSYNTSELCNICLDFLDKFEIDRKTKEVIEKHFNSIPQSTLDSPNFGLARYSRNVASKISSISARRHWQADDNSYDISIEDVETALSQLSSEAEQPKIIGFSG